MWMYMLIVMVSSEEFVGRRDPRLRGHAASATLIFSGRHGD